MAHASPTAVNSEVEPARDTVESTSQNANLNASCPCLGICADEG
jgi:gamma-glutamyl-gamma-aminobutyrate hydrolase PuuD